MKERARYGIGLALLLLTAAVLILLNAEKKEQRHAVSFPAMGTVATLTFYTDEATFLKAVKTVREVFEQITAVANVHAPQSELSRLNKEAGKAPFACSPLMWELLKESRLAYELSEGAFDISVKPLLDHWGFYKKKIKKIPPAQETAKIRNLTGLAKIKFNDARCTIRFPKEGYALDFGGIAKGHAIELASSRVMALGIRRGIIDLGGNLRLLPEPPPGKECYNIGIRRPSRERGGVMPRILQLPGNCAVSSSGDYERYVKLENRYFGHIMDPATGVPAPGKIAVTAVSTTGARSDWLSTAVYLRGEKLARKLQKELKNTQFYIIKKQKLRL